MQKPEILGSTAHKQQLYPLQPFKKYPDSDNKEVKVVLGPRIMGMAQREEVEISGLSRGVVGSSSSSSSSSAAAAAAAADEALLEEKSASLEESFVSLPPLEDEDGGNLMFEEVKKKDRKRYAEAVPLTAKRAK